MKEWIVTLMSAKRPVKEGESAFKVYKTGVSKHSRCAVPCWVYGKAEEHGTKQNCWMSVILLLLLISGCQFVKVLNMMMIIMVMMGW